MWDTLEEKWRMLCGREDLERTGTHRICAGHFERHMFLNDLKNRLQPHAEPTIFPALEECSSKYDHTYGVFNLPLLNVNAQTIKVEGLDDSSQNSDTHDEDNKDLFMCTVPIGPVDTKQEEEIETTDYGVVGGLVDNFRMDNSSTKCDKDDEGNKQFIMCMIPAGAVDIKQEEEEEATDYGVGGGLIDNFILDDPLSKCDKDDEGNKHFMCMVPVSPVDIKQEEEVETTDYGVVGGLIDNFSLDDSPEKCDEDFLMLTVPVGPPDTMTQEEDVEATNYEIEDIENF